MSHPFGNDTYRFGSAAFVEAEELEQAGMFRKTRSALYVGAFDGRSLWWSGEGGVLLVAGARSGKLRDILAYNVCSGVLSHTTLLILDVKGELAAISQDQTPDQKFCLYWNPFALHGLPQHRINPFSHLRWSSPTLFSDMKVSMQTLLPQSGAGNSRYFELNARRIGEAFGLTLTKINGVLTMPELYEAVLLLMEGGRRWLDFAWEMHASGIPACKSVEAEIHAARDDSSGGFKGIIGELMQALSCMSDPVLRDSLSQPFTAEMEDLLSREQAYQLYMMCPAEMIETWAPVIKSIFTSAKTLKARSPHAPRQTWIIDEAARLTGYAEIPALFTDGAGIGIRPVAVFQDVAQMNDLAPNAERKISSSAAVQIYFGIRDLTSATRVSNMLGSETLIYDDLLNQSRAEVDYRKAFRSVLGGSDPFEAVFELDQKRFETVHLSVQHRKLRLPDEVMRTPGNRMFVFADGLSGPVYASRSPYWDQPWMAGRYHPNPYHPPCDRVRVRSRFGPRWRPVITEPVPEAFAHYPQYQSGLWSIIGR